MRRKLFTCLSALTLLLCLTVIGVWIKSYVGGLWADPPRFTIGHTWYTVDWGPGIIFAHVQSEAFESWPMGEFKFLGFAYFSNSPNHKEFDVPLWFLALMTAILPALWYRAAMRRPSRSNLCKQCGYDLRASEGACPECGKRISAIDC